MPVLPTPPRKSWAREQCAALEETGLIEEERLERLELVCGELINKMGKNRPHASALALLWELIEAFGKQMVNSETTIDVSPEDNPTSEPQPDLIVLKRKTQTFTSN